MNERDEHDTEEPARVVIRDKRRLDPETGQPRQVTGEPRHAADDEEGGDDLPSSADSDLPPGALFEPRRKASPSPGGAALQRKLAERTADLQRVTAEYANYRKRVERDKVAAGELAAGGVLATLLPVLDNLDSAREHGDLTGPFKAVADQFTGILDRYGLESFGDEGDAFDPMIHEAVAHQTSADVTEPTCVSIMRRGYRHGERLLRPALVGVADPEPTPEPASSPAPDTPSPAGPAMPAEDATRTPDEPGAEGTL